MKILFVITLLKIYISSNYKKTNTTCNKSPELLGNWFKTHGSYSLLETPIPKYTKAYSENFYSDPTNPPYLQKADKFYCGIKYIQKNPSKARKKPYNLKNFISEISAKSSGYSITHKGHCGACSSPQDLGVYLTTDLTNPTRHCGLIGLFSSAKEMECLLQIGFSQQCATVWAWNIFNTKRECFWTCMYHWIRGSRNNNDDGSLNSCILCDEERSGPNFKFFSGRTRRNSGIVSEIDRGTEEIYEMSHCYFYDLEEALQV